MGLGRAPWPTRAPARAGSQAFYKVIKVEVIFFAIQKDKIQVPLKKEKKQTPPDNHTGI